MSLMISLLMLDQTLLQKSSSTGKDFYDYLKYPIDSCMFPIVETEIIQIICKFKQNKCACHKDIGNFIVKRMANEIALPLSTIFNESLLKSYTYYKFTFF